MACRFPFLCALCGAPLSVSRIEPAELNPVSAHRSTTAHQRVWQQKCPPPLPQREDRQHHHVHSQLQQHTCPQQQQQQQQQQGVCTLQDQQPRQVGARSRTASRKQPCSCSGCGAMHYCCEAHRNHHARMPGGHSPEECSRMAGQVRRGEELSDFPFPWSRSIGMTLPYDQVSDLGVQSSGLLGEQITDAALPLPQQQPPIQRQLTVCELLRSIRSASRPPEEGTAGARLRGDPSPAMELGEAVQIAAMVGSGAGGSCTAPGCWRHVCGCNSAGGRGGAGDGALHVEEGEWGYRQTPLLAQVRLPHRTPPLQPELLEGQPQPPLQQPLPPKVPPQPPAGAFPAQVCIAGLVRNSLGGGPPGVSEGTAPGRAQQAAVDVMASAALRDGSRAAAGSGTGAVPKQLSAPAQAWDQAAWAARVWHLPALLAPPLQGPPGSWNGGGGPGGNSNNVLPAPPAEPPAGGRGCCGGVADWLSYYRWAGLPLESPAALLLHFPLTLYGVLRLVDERLGGALLSGPAVLEGRAGAGNGDVPAAGAAARAEPTSAVKAEAGAKTSEAVSVSMAAVGPGPGGHTGGEDAGANVRDAPPHAKRQRLAGEQQVCAASRARPLIETSSPACEVRQQRSDGGRCVDLRDPMQPPQQQQLRGGNTRQTERQQEGGLVLSACGDEGSMPAGPNIGGGDGGNRWRVDVLYLGPQSELDQLDTFAVLLPLLPPGCTLRLHMVGPDVPEALHGAVLVYDGDSLGVMASTHGCMTAGKTGACSGDAVAQRSGAGWGRGEWAAAAGAGHDADPGATVGHNGGGQAILQYTYDDKQAAFSPRLELVLHSCLLHEPDGLLGLACEGMDEPRSSLSNGAYHSSGDGPGGALPYTSSGRHGDEDDEGRSSSSAHGDTSTVPLVVFAPNAGLPVYLSWLPSLELLLPSDRQQRPVRQAQGSEVGHPSRLGGSEGSATAAAHGIGTDVGTLLRSTSASAETSGMAAPMETRGVMTVQPASTVVLPGAGGPTAGVLARPRFSLRKPLASIFTAYNEEECVRTCQMLEQLYNVRPDLEAVVNPFRQPLWCVGRTGNSLPSYSNGFLYGWLSV